MRRILAFTVDWLVAALWGGALFGVVMIATGGEPPRPESPWTGQLIGFLAMTLPFTVYFAACESSKWSATIGKRFLNFRVLTTSGESLSFGSAFLRNAIKFVPWEFGHIVAQHAAFSDGDAFPVWLWGPALISMVGPLWWLTSLFLNGATPYDRWTGARVASAGREKT